MNQSIKLAVILVLLTLLAACSGQSASEPAEPSTAGTTQETESPTNETPTTRTVSHSMGETNVPIDPQRVVVLDTGELDSVLALGVTPVGAVEAFAGAGLPSYLDGMIEGIELVGTIQEPNLETIVQLDPDLIISSKLRHEEIYDELSQIAPTVFAEAVGVVWKENFMLAGNALNKTKETEQIMMDYETRLATFQSTVGNPNDIEVSMVRFTPTQIRIYEKANFIGTVLEDTGLSRPPAQTDDVFMTEANKELITEMEGDIMFVTVYGNPAETAQEEFRSDPLWQQLEVVQAGEVYEVPDDYWMLGIGIIAANRVVDDLFRIVGEVDPANVSPNPFRPNDSTLAATFTGDGEVRPFTDAQDRTVELPANPQRVVTLTEIDLDSALALGLTPVGSVNGRGQQTLPAYLGDQTQDVVSVGSLAEPSLEQVVALNPDLILAGNIIPPVEALLPELSEIAPVVATFKPGDDWKTTFAVVAEALNRPDEAETFLAQYDAQAAQIAASLGDDTVEASVTRWMPQGPVVMVPSSFSSLVLADAGLIRPEAHAGLVGNHPAHSDPISLEALDVIDADWIFMGTLNEEGATSLAEAETNILFQQLSAVQNEQVILVDGTVWTSVGGPLAAMQVLEDVATSLEVSVSAAPATEGTRLISHAMAETEVSANPQRVVVLDTGETDNALALGANIVGAPVSDVQQYQGYLTEQLAGITDIGTISEPNLEVILSLKPDLILGSKQRYEEIYDELAQIAPTIFSESLRVPWQDNFRLHAKALGRTAEADQLLADYNTRAAEVQAALSDDQPTISIIRFRPGQVRLYLKSSYIGYILQDVGLPRPPSQDEDVFSSEISLEQIADVDADVIFITGYAQDDSELDNFLESSLWQTLGAVQNDRAIDVNDDTWIAGLGVQAATLVLDDLEQYLVSSSN